MIRTLREGDTTSVTAPSSEIRYTREVAGIAQASGLAMGHKNPAGSRICPRAPISVTYTARPPASAAAWFEKGNRMGERGGGGQDAFVAVAVDDPDHQRVGHHQIFAGEGQTTRVFSPATNGLTVPWSTSRTRISPSAPPAASPWIET